MLCCEDTEEHFIEVVKTLVKQGRSRDARIEEELDRPLPSDYIQEIADLSQRLTYVIENYVVCEENSFTFPDGYTWKRE